MVLDPEGAGWHVRLDTTLQEAPACGDSTENDKLKWQVRNPTAILSKLLGKSCRLGYGDGNSLYARSLRDSNPML